MPDILPNILFLRGLKDDGFTRIVKVINNNQVLYNCEGSCNVFENLESEYFSKQLITLDANQLQDISYADCDLVFNQISNADTHRTSLSKAGKLVDALNSNATEQKISCINHPLKIANISRHTLPGLIAGIHGITVPECVRLQADSGEQIENKIEELNWQYPVVIRQRVDHDGLHIQKIENPFELSQLPYTYFENDCYLMPFHDYADSNGIFRKLRLVMVDGELIIRHVLYNDNWQVSSNARSFMKKNSWYYDHEKKLIEQFDANIKPHIHDAMQSVHKAIGLDYYGIDCVLDADMNLLIFGINPDMNILFHKARTPNIWAPQIDLVKEQIIKMVMKRCRQTQQAS